MNFRDMSKEHLKYSVFSIDDKQKQLWNEQKKRDENNYYKRMRSDPNNPENWSPEQLYIFCHEDDFGDWGVD